MNVKTTYILAALVILVGLFVLLDRPWKRQTPAETGGPAAAEESVLDPKPQTEAIDRIEITPAGKTKLAFARPQDAKDDEYQIVEPIQAPAVSWRVRNAINAVLDMKVRRAYAKSDKNRPSDEEAGLSPPAFVVTLHDKEADRSHTVHAGKSPPLSTDTYVRVEGGDELLVVHGRLAETLGTPLEDYRNKSLLAHIASNDVQRVRIEGIRSYELARTDDGWLIESPVRTRADKAKADALVNAARAIVARKFVDDEPASLAAYGLEEPGLRVSVYAEKKVEKPAEEEEPGEAEDQTETPEEEPEPQVETIKQEATVLVGGQAGDDYFAKLADQPWVFTIASSTFKNLSTELSELRDKKLASFAKDKVTRIELAVGESSATLEKSDNEWRMPGDVKAELLAVDDLLKSARDLTASSFVDETGLADLGFDQPRADISLTVAGQEAPVRLQVGNATIGGQMVYVRDPAANVIAVVPKDAADVFLRTPVSYRSRDMISFNKALANYLAVDRDDGRWVIEKVGNQWILVEPEQGEAEQQAVTDILSDLYNLRGRSVVGIDDLGAFGLEDPQLVVSVRYQPLPQPVMEPATQPATQPATTQEAATQPASTQPAADVPTTKPVWVEQPPVTHIVRVAERDGTVYATADETGVVCEIDRKIYDNLRAELLDRRVARFEASQAVGLTYTSGGGTIELSRVGDQWTYTGDPALPIDAAKVTDALNALRELKTNRYVALDAEDLGAYGLDAPAMAVSVMLADQPAVELAVSGTGPEGDAQRARYARSSGSNRVFLLLPDQLGALSKSVSDFKKDGS